MNIQVLSDQHLLNNYRSGDQSAISKLIERHKRRVRDYIYMMVKDNDVADDIFPLSSRARRATPCLIPTKAPAPAAWRPWRS